MGGSEDLNSNSNLISIPTPLFKRIEQRIRGTGFSSVSSYVSYVLREILAEEENEAQTLSPADEERVKERLRALGYLD